MGLNNFMCCMKLETGGWWTFLSFIVQNKIFRQNFLLFTCLQATLLVGQPSFGISYSQSYLECPSLDCRRLRAMISTSFWLTTSNSTLIKRCTMNIVWSRGEVSVDASKKLHVDVSGNLNIFLSLISTFLVLIFLMTLMFFFCICCTFLGYQCVRGVTTVSKILKIL